MEQVFQVPHTDDAARLAPADSPLIASPNFWAIVSQPSHFFRILRSRSTSNLHHSAYLGIVSSRYILAPFLDNLPEIFLCHLYLPVFDHAAPARNRIIVIYPLLRRTVEPIHQSAASVTQSSTRRLPLSYSTAASWNSDCDTYQLCARHQNGHIHLQVVSRNFLLVTQLECSACATSGRTPRDRSSSWRSRHGSRRALETVQVLEL